MLKYIEEECRDDTAEELIKRIDSICDNYGLSYSQITIEGEIDTADYNERARVFLSYQRPATPEEEAASQQFQLEQQARVRDAELATLAKLKAKYDHQ